MNVKKNTHSVKFHVIFSRKLRQNAFLSLHYLFHVSIGYLSLYGAEMYELEVAKSSARCHYTDFRDKTIYDGNVRLWQSSVGHRKTEISVFGSQSVKRLIQ